MDKKIIDLTDVTRIEFEVLRVKFPIEDGEPVPPRKSVIDALLVNAAMLSIVIKDPAMKSRLGMDGIEAPRRHQRKMASACMSLAQKLRRYDADQYLLLMNLVGLSNRLAGTEGEAGISAVFDMFNTPIAVDPVFLVPSRPADPTRNTLVELVELFMEQVEDAYGGAASSSEPQPPRS